MPDLKLLDTAEAMRITAILNQEWPNFSEKWKMQDIGYDYIRSKQYSNEEEEYFERLRRPTHVFNMMFEKLNHIIGNHYLNDQRQKVFHRGGGSAQMADIWMDWLDYTHTKNDYKYELGRTVFAGWLGMGFIIPRWSNERDIDGSVFYENEDEYMVGWDTRARHYFLDDAKYMWRQRWMTGNDILEERSWSKRKRSELEGIIRETKEMQGIWDNAPALTNSTDYKWSDKHKGKYRVVEFHEIVWDYTEVAIKPDGDAVIVSFKDQRRNDLYHRAHPDYKFVERKEKIKRIKTVIPGLNTVIDERKADVQDGQYDIIGYFPYPYGRKTIDHYGMVQVVKGPQDFLNDMENVNLDSLQKSISGNIEYVPDAYENADHIPLHGNETGFMFQKKAKYIGTKTLEQLKLSGPNAAAVQMVEEAKAFIELLTATAELTGKEKDMGAPASLYAQKVAQGQIKFAVPNAMLHMVKKRLNEKCIKLAQANIDTPKFLKTRTTESDENKVMVNIPWGDQILNNTQVGEYEVVVNEADQNPTATLVRAARKEAFVQNIIIPLFSQQAALAIDWDWLLKESDLGDMQQQIETIKNLIQQASKTQEEQTALQKMNALLDTTQKNVNLLDGGNAQESVSQSRSQRPTPLEKGR